MKPYEIIERLQYICQCVESGHCAYTHGKDVDCPECLRSLEAARDHVVRMGGGISTATLVLNGGYNKEKIIEEIKGILDAADRGYSLQMELTARVDEIPTIRYEVKKSIGV